jgi:methionyl-tRNA formyltransferase
MENQINSSEIVIMTTHGEAANAYINGLAAHFPNLVVIRETLVSGAEIAKIRAKNHGKFYVLHERLAAVPRKILSKLLSGHFNAVKSGLPFSCAAPNNIQFYDVETINSPQAHALLKTLNPKVVAVYSTRIVKKSTLQASNATFLNFHAGLTPFYRGQYTLYWALARGEPQKAGGTVHVVDTGIDTGAVVAQEIIALNKKDISPIHAFVALPQGVKMMAEAIKNTLSGKLKPIAHSHETLHTSPFYRPPTLLQYLYNGLTKNVW